MMLYIYILLKFLPHSVVENCNEVVVKLRCEFKLELFVRRARIT